MFTHKPTNICKLAYICSHMHVHTDNPTHKHIQLIYTGTHTHTHTHTHPVYFTAYMYSPHAVIHKHKHMYSKLPTPGNALILALMNQPQTSSFLIHMITHTHTD